MLSREILYSSILIVVGTSQMAADLLHLPPLKALAAATMIAPCPKVFTAHNGYETFSTNFVLTWQDKQAKQHALKVSRSIYERIQGPYARRKIFEAVVVYWPIASTNKAGISMFNAASKYALTGNAPLMREFGVDPTSIAGPVTIHFLPAPGTDMGTLPRAVTIQS